VIFLWQMMRGARSEKSAGSAWQNYPRCDCVDFVHATAVKASDHPIAFFDEEECVQPTRFALQEHEVLRELVHQLAADCPVLMASKHKLLEAVAEEFDAQQGAS
jgi:hypothetical protein